MVVGGGLGGGPDNAVFRPGDTVLCRPRDPPAPGHPKGRRVNAGLRGVGPERVVLRTAAGPLGRGRVWATGTRKGATCGSPKGWLARWVYPLERGGSPASTARSGTETKDTSRDAKKQQNNVMPATR